MKLLTAEIRKEIPALYSQENVEDPIAVVKFFHPLSSMTWYATEGSPVDENGIMIAPGESEGPEVDFLFFGLFTSSTDEELCYFSLNEMSETVVHTLGMERDLHWKPRKLSEIRKQ